MAKPKCIKDAEVIRDRMAQLATFSHEELLDELTRCKDFRVVRTEILRRIRILDIATECDGQTIDDYVAAAMSQEQRTDCANLRAQILARMSADDEPHCECGVL